MSVRDWSKKLIENLSPRRGTIIYLACFPKSGSTYISNLISRITQFPRGSATYVYGHNEQDIYEPALCRQKPAVIQQHTKGTGHNILILQKHGIKPVLLVRNIFDVVLSLYDHIERDDPVMPSVYIHRTYFEMDRQDRLMFLIKGALPWYFNYLASWNDASREIDCMWITYEEFFADQPKSLERIFAFNDLEIKPQHIQDVLATHDSRRDRFNVGISGRGADLPVAHKQAITDLARTWHLNEDLARKVGII